MTVAEVQEKMAQSDASLESVRFTYVQEMRSSLTEEVQTSSGIACFKKPRNLRIEQKEPLPQLIVSSGKYVFIYTPRFKQVLKDSWDRYFSKSSFFPGLIGFQETMQKLKDRYQWNVAEVSDLNGEKILHLRLKSLGTDTDQMDLWIAQSDFIPRKAEMVTGTLKVTTTLVALEKNPSLGPELFKFERPEESRVISVP